MVIESFLKFSNLKLMHKKHKKYKIITNIRNYKYIYNKC